MRQGRNFSHFKNEEIKTALEVHGLQPTDIAHLSVLELNLQIRAIIIIAEEIQRRAAQGGLSVTPLPPPLTGLHLTLLKGRRVQAWCAHLPGSKRISAY